MEQLGLSWSTDKKYVFNCDVHNFAENAEMIFGYKIPHCRDRLLLHKHAHFVVVPKSAGYLMF